MPASTAAAAPTTSEPRLVVKRFWAISTTSNSSLFGHHDHAGTDAGWVTGFGSVSADLVEVKDEVADNEAGIVTRCSIVRMRAGVAGRRAGIAGIVEATTVPGVTRDVEVAETAYRYGARCSVDLRERAVRSQIRIQDPRNIRTKSIRSISGRIGRVELEPVVVAGRTVWRAELGFLVAAVKSRVE